MFSIYKKLILFLILFQIVEAGIISSLSGPMASAVSSINSKATNVMNGYESSMQDAKNKADEINELYKLRRENIESIFWR